MDHGEGGFTTAVVERKLMGGSRPNIACLPSKNIIHSAKLAELHRRFFVSAGAHRGRSYAAAASVS